MHSGFATLRNQFPMDLRKRDNGQALARHRRRHRAHRRDLEEGRERFGASGNFLCGAFGIVDAFWCPVAFRFRSYGVTLTGAAASYCQALLALPAMLEWEAAAVAEREVIERPDGSHGASAMNGPRRR